MEADIYSSVVWMLGYISERDIRCGAGQMSAWKIAPSPCVLKWWKNREVNLFPPGPFKRVVISFQRLYHFKRIFIYSLRMMYDVFWSYVSPFLQPLPNTSLPSPPWSLWSPVCVGWLLLDVGPALESDPCTRYHSTEKNRLFLSLQLSNVNGSSAMNGSAGLIPLYCAWILIGLSSCRSYHSLGLHFNMNWDWRDLSFKPLLVCEVM